MFCPHCGKDISPNAASCPNCGEPNPNVSSSQQQVVIPQKDPNQPQHVSSAWYLLPFFLGFIGGLIAWAVNKDINARKARNMLIFGIVWTFLGIILVVIIGAAMAAAFAGAVASRGAYGFLS